MKSGISRRSVLQQFTLAAGGAAATRILGSPHILRAANAPGRLNCVVIGCGARGMSHLAAAAGHNQGDRSSQNLMAVVDADEAKLASVLKWAKGKDLDPDRIQTFTDYRPMFDKIGKQLDAVFIATPNHQHALPAMMAMQLGKCVYCEKPLTHTIAEARKLAEMARTTKVATQMGNQGHCEEGYRRLCEYVWSGAVGRITETHSWTGRSNGGIGPRPASAPVPAGLNWDAWLGPAPARDYHADLHPHQWHGWHDFGNGSLGNMGCHVLDGVYWALKLEHPVRIEAEQVFGGSDQRYPTGTRLRWDFPARAGQPAVKVYWYDGRIGVGDTGDDNKATPKGPKGKSNLPPLVQELKQKFPEEKFDDSGTIYVGEKGILYTSTYGNHMHIVPKKLMLETPEPPKSLPRTSGSFGDFIRACKERTNQTASSFDYSARLTEFTLLGNLAQLAGEGRPVEWDGPNMKVTNLTALNQYVKQEYRKGWMV
ncbi:MAG: gfo/Idh/MocA family oxidoreductase [Proteobacteria bacterium]|nr:gfo/Idh/MocA family oxidoreductase [Pseudomonadota bacterium]